MSTSAVQVSVCLHHNYACVQQTLSVPAWQMQSMQHSTELTICMHGTVGCVRDPLMLSEPHWALTM